METHPYVVDLAGGRPIIEPKSPRRSWFNSRRFVNADGTFEPVLFALATRLYPDIDMSKHKPFWKDCNWSNETPENVGVLTQAESRVMKNSIGLPSGSPAYYAAYRKAHPERFKQYARAYRSRRHAEAEERARELKEKLAAEEADRVPDPRVAEMQRRLEELLSGTPTTKPDAEA